MRASAAERPSSSETPPAAARLGPRLVFPRWRLVMGRLFALATFGSGIVYLNYRLTTIADNGWLGWALWAAEGLAFVSLLLLGVCLWNTRVREMPPGPPLGTLDVLIPVCGEPVDMVERTLLAALAIDYPHRTWILNDGRVAGKGNWQAIDELAHRHRVVALTRTTGDRGKARNLNYGLTHTSAELVAVIDADHQADPLFAHEMLGYFSDDAVGFVCTPQRFEGVGDGDILNNEEAFFYGCVQPAKDVYNSAYSCGNGVVYRRAALQAVGGFSEWNLVEDLHTSYLIHARGWKSVYHPRAVTIGTAPRTASDLSRQRLTWATDSLRILFLDCPLLRSGLTPMQRLHYLHTSTNYIAGIAQLFFWLSPVLYLLWHLPTMSPTSLSAYGRYSIPYFSSVLGFFAVFVGVDNTIRTFAQRLFLSPVFLMATVRAIASRRPRPGVTEKHFASRFSWSVLPSLTIVALLLVAMSYAILDQKAATRLSILIAAGYIFAVAGPATALSVNPRRQRILRFALRGCVLLISFLVLLMGYLYLD